MPLLNCIASTHMETHQLLGVSPQCAAWRVSWVIEKALNSKMLAATKIRCGGLSRGSVRNQFWLDDPFIKLHGAYGRCPISSSPSEEEMGHWTPMGIEPKVYDDSFIHSFIPAISIAPLQVLYYSEALLTTARILYRRFTPKHTGNCR